MATEIKVPALGESVTEATVAQWLKQPGDSVEVDEPLVELETDKVTLEVNATSAGILSEIVVAEGENVEVGALLGTIGEGNGQAVAPAPAPAAPPEPAPSPAPAAAAPQPAAAQPAAVSSGETMDIVVPALGESVTEATVAQWLKQPGEAVGADEALVELETDKVTLEVNAPAAGTLSEIKAEAGATVEVGALLASFAAGAAGNAPAAQPSAAAPTPATEEPPAPAAAPEPTAGAGLDPAQVGRTDGKVTVDDLNRFIAASTPPSALTLSPAVAKLVAEHNLDASRIVGSGPQGRITKEDVQAVIAGTAPLRERPTVAAPAPEARAPAPAQAPLPAGVREERVRMTKLRQTIAKRLKEAQNTAAILTTFNEADMSAVIALRQRYKESFEKKHGIKLGFSSFFVKACVKALKEIPAVNGRIEGDEIVYNHFYDIGMAVSTPNGLMVPVIRDCDDKSFAEIEGALGELAGRGRDGKLSMDEMQGGTFTITNGGVFGSLLSTPILNRPQSAILGLHKISQRAMVVDGKVEARPMMYLALSYDHRIVDGREAVTFLVKVKEAIEDPERLLLDL